MIVAGKVIRHAKPDSREITIGAPELRNGREEFDLGSRRVSEVKQLLRTLNHCSGRGWRIHIAQPLLYVDQSVGGVCRLLSCRVLIVNALKIFGGLRQVAGSLEALGQEQIGLRLGNLVVVLLDQIQSIF